MKLPPCTVIRHLLLALIAQCAMLGSVQAQTLEPSAVGVQLSVVDDPSGLGDAWLPGHLPDNWRRSHPGLMGPNAWYRVEFDLPARRPGSGSWSLYIPYLYDGGRFWLNGEPLASIAQTTQQLHVRWERPHLITMPDSQLHEGRNVLLLRAVLTDPGSGLRLQRMTIGPSQDLLPLYDRRIFWVRTMPQMASATCLIVGVFVLFIWLRRRSEVLYGLFGLAAVLWSIRTLTFVIEVMPAPWWPWWRAVYHSATGGFIVVLAIFAMRFAGVRRPRVELALALYWLVGPLAMLASGGRLDSVVGFVWTGGLIPIGFTIVGFTAWAAWRQRTSGAIALAAAIALATLAGVHDYVVAWDGAWHIPAPLQSWAAHRVFLLHHGANVLLLVMVGILTMRFIHALDDAEVLNRNLEDRVAARERELSERHAQVAQLEREQAAGDERQRIMQDLHDGLGSHLFTSLSRLERGSLDVSGAAQVLRDCIAEMRLVFDVAVPADAEFSAVLGEFLARWHDTLDEAGVRITHRIDLERPIRLAPASALQVLRILQEALTNVFKHAHASSVAVTLVGRESTMSLSVRDDGRGTPAVPTAGRGLSNMTSRAQRLGATLSIEPARPGTLVSLVLPLGPHER